MAKSVEHYDFTKGNNGVAVIFNHQTFDRKDDRPGSHVDRDRLINILTIYGFEVRPYNDLTVLEIYQTLEKLKKENHKNNNCLLVVVLTHGSPNQLWARDDKYSIDTLFQPFYGDSCHDLLNKPKLFFIQACRGGKTDLGASLTHDYCDEISHRIPITADFFVMYSTFEDHVSVRNPVTGSWFIQTFCKELENAKDEGLELVELSTGVSYRVAHQFWSKNIKTTQMPVTCSTLTKLCFLKPKPKENM